MINRVVNMARKTDVRNEILKILGKHSEGLTIIEIADMVGMTRYAVTKYVYQLLGEKLISQRIIGTAKLCCLKGKKHARKL